LFAGAKAFATSERSDDLMQASVSWSGLTEEIRKFLSGTTSMFYGRYLVDFQE
jgi:hypothetical protein